ncbi:MAG: pyridoxal phosphate-dependent aminotransferase [gamma proteobacterium endosymbiont of Lamellibrachia anaximandri]|nr:pyridoxal phosphate-dependent aminotransferase [gamma proteobacterium endosymbiont of Lamellibrachia anaximandri]
MIPIADRMARIKPFYVMDLLAKAHRLEAEGRSIIHMEIGEPDFITPAPIIHAGEVALAAGETHYTPAKGLPALREAIAGFYVSSYGVDIDPARIIVTPGASGALQLMMSMLINPGESVLMADPGYPCNRHFVELVNGTPIGVPVGADTGYQLTAEIVETAWRPDTKAVLVATPANPTGTLLTLEALTALHDTVSRLGGLLIVDEIYQGLIYDAVGGTALSIDDDIFVINSFSKFFGMTGWRLGWLVAPEAAVDPLDRLAQNIFLAAPTLSQHAALKAFEPEVLEILEARRVEYLQRRDFLLPELRGMGFELPVTPQGAFYLYANCEAVTDDSHAFAEALLEEAGVAVTPGRDFGFNRPEAHLRFAYTTSLPNLEEGVARLRNFIRM